MLIKTSQQLTNLDNVGLHDPAGKPLAFRDVATNALLNAVPGDKPCAWRQLYILATRIWDHDLVDLSAWEAELIQRRIVALGQFNYLIVGRIHEMIDDAKRRDLIHAVAQQAEAAPVADDVVPGEQR